VNVSRFGELLAFGINFSTSPFENQGSLRARLVISALQLHSKVESRAENNLLGEKGKQGL